MLTDDDDVHFPADASNTVSVIRTVVTVVWRKFSDNDDNNNTNDDDDGDGDNDGDGNEEEEEEGENERNRQTHIYIYKYRQNNLHFFFFFCVPSIVGVAYVAVFNLHLTMLIHGGKGNCSLISRGKSS